MTVLEYFLVFVLTILAGGWSIPTGVLFGLNPFGVYFAAVLGSILTSAIALSLGGPLRDRLVARFFPDADERVARSKAGEIIDRWGLIGFATLGAALLGPTMTLLTALVLGLERMRFLRWYVVGTVVGFALLTAFWVVVT